MLGEKTPVFVSYRRTDHRHGRADGTTSPDEVVQQFHHKLCDDVAQLVAIPRGCDMSFLDIEAMPGGTNWHPELLHALGRCQIMVALLSMPYVHSDWCGKEWYAFTSRSKILLKNASQNQSNIVPVRWAPIPDEGELPAAVTQHTNIFSPKGTKKNPDLPHRYARDGLYRLMRASEDDVVGEIIWQLALLIQDISYKQRLEARDFKADDLINAFEGGQT